MREIALDIGNTRIKIGLFEQGQLSASIVFGESEIDSASEWIESCGAKRLIYSSTAEKEFPIQSLLPPSCDCIALESDSPWPLENHYQSASLGLDRMANAVAGHVYHPSACLIIDAGTCITYDWVSQGQYLGGGISPGLHMRFRAMNAFTGRLPLIEFAENSPLIGRTTAESMRSGAQQGMLLEVAGIIRQFHLRFPEGKVISTGGDGQWLAAHLENDIFADPFATLRGLYGILKFKHA